MVVPAHRLADMVLQVPELIENQGRAAVKRDLSIGGHTVGPLYIHTLQFIRAQAPDLDVLRNRLVQSEAVLWVDAETRTHRQDLCIGVLV